MCPICYYHEIAGLIQPKLSMFSTCNHWFQAPSPPVNGNLEDIPESWSGPNSNTSASQDRVRTTLLTTIGGQTLPNLVRVPNNIIQPTVLRSLMEGPIQPWQCLVWAEGSPPPYSQDLPPIHMSGPSHVLLQIRLYYEDINGEYQGGGVIEEEENEGGGASIE